MILLGTYLKIADNSGAKRAQCIKVLGGSNRKVARVGDRVVVSIQSLRPLGRARQQSRNRILKGSVHHAIVLRVKKEHRRKDGSLLAFGDNAIALLKAQGQPAGSRLFGPVLEDLRLTKNLKLVSLASSLV